MEIKISTNQILKILYVISWIIFIGICIEAGGFIFNTFFALVINPIGTNYFWKQMDLSSLYQFDRGYFFVVTLLMSIATVMKAGIFYHIVKILHDKKLNLLQPFNKDVERFIFNLSYLTLGTGIISWWATKYTQWIIKQGVEMPDIEYLRIGGADVWLFMSVTLYVIAQIFKKGIEIQSENELTI